MWFQFLQFLYVQVYKGKQYNTDNTLGLFKILVIIFNPYFIIIWANIWDYTEEYEILGLYFSEMSLLIKKKWKGKGIIKCYHQIHGINIIIKICLNLIACGMF